MKPQASKAKLSRSQALPRLRVRALLIDQILTKRDKYHAFSDVPSRAVYPGWMDIEGLASPEWSNRNRAEAAQKNVDLSRPGRNAIADS